MTTSAKIKNLQQAEDLTRSKWEVWFQAKVAEEDAPSLSASLSCLRAIAAEVAASIDVVPFLAANPETLKLKTWSFDGQTIEETIRIGVSAHAAARCDEALRTAIKNMNADKLLIRVHDTIKSASHIVLVDGVGSQAKDALEALKTLQALHTSTLSLPGLNDVFVCLLKLRNDLGAIKGRSRLIGDDRKKEIERLQSDVNDLIELRGMDYIWFQNSLQENLTKGS